MRPSFPTGSVLPIALPLSAIRLPVRAYHSRTEGHRKSSLDILIPHATHNLRCHFKVEFKNHGQHMPFKAWTIMRHMLIIRLALNVESCMSCRPYTTRTAKFVLLLSGVHQPSEPLNLVMRAQELHLQ